MKTPYTQWCGYGTWHYYKNNLYFCVLNAKSFLSHLENAIDNNLPISNIEIPYDKFKIDHSEFEKQYYGDEFKEAGAIYLRIFNKLEKSKFIMKKERKIEIFNVWIYWVAGSNYGYVRYLKMQISADFYSMEKCLENARSILYEEKNLSCCLNYKRTNLDPNHLKIIESLYDDMMIQRDL